MKKLLYVIEIKSEYEENYKKIHKEAWKEMLKALKEAGFTKEVIFFHNHQSIVYFEFPDDVSYEECNVAVKKMDICKKWDMTVNPWFEKSPVMAEKIFDLEQQLNDE